MAHREINVSAVEHVISFRFALLSVFVVDILFSTYGIGFAKAKQQSSFYVAKIQPEMVVLLQTENRLIVAPFDRENGLIDPGFTVMSIEDLDSVLFFEEEVGPLKINKAAIIDPSKRFWQPTQTPTSSSP